MLYSEEPPVNGGSSVPGSISFVPSLAGLMIAGEVIRDILKFGEDPEGKDGNG